MNINSFPDYYRQYAWGGKHSLYGYSEDSYPEFQWIASLEKRFAWLREQSIVKETASKYLIREMIEWGGSQNGVLQKFEDNCGEVNLYELVQNVIRNLDQPADAISAALSFPGFGLTYASKLLRFLKPETYGALDSRIRDALLREERLPIIRDGDRNSMKNGYVQFLALLCELKAELKSSHVRKPDCALSNNGIWRPSEIEMALFRWAENR